MPKIDRLRTSSVRNSGQYYHLSPVSATQPYTDYYSVQPMTNMSTSPYATSTQQSTSSYNTGGPVQPIHQTQYSTLQSHTPTTAPLTSLRPSSGAWNPTDDQTLMAARASGMNWAPIQQAYFPSKTSNACRKRHERLMERRSADDWDGQKLDTLAKNYIELRREIWTPLAEATGEKWSVVEQKCMQQGLKNLQNAARSQGRRERLLSPSAAHSHSHSQHSPSSFPPYSSSSSSNAYIRDDSGIGLEDMEGGDYNDGSSERISPSSSAYGGQSYGHGHGHGHSHSGGSGVGSVGGYGVHHGHGGRLASMDMGIDAIINRPRH